MPNTATALSGLLRRIRPPLLIFLSTVYFAGCSLGGFISAYFNTYYNARTLFNQAEEEIRTQKLTGVRQGPEAYLAPYGIQSPTRTKLNSVIEKCSKLLQYHPESGLVEDALLMIGQSYFYEDENQKAERKFKELLEGYPQSGLFFDAKLYLSQVYYRMNDATGAMNTAKELLDAAEKDGNDDMMAKAATVCANVQLNNKDYPQSITYFQIVAKRGKSAEDRAAAQVKMAEIYQTQGQFSNAADAYRRAEDEGGTYVVTYRARIGEARMISKVGKPKAALSALQDLRSNANNREFYGEIDLEIGNVLVQMDAVEDAVAQYRYVDTSYARTEISARSYYALGLLYETRLALYDSARIVYNKVRFESPTSEVGLLAAHRADYLNRLATLRDQLAKLDSARLAILNPSQAAPVDSSRRDSALTHTVTTDTSKGKIALKTVPLSLDSIQAGRARATIELGSLFYFDIGALDSSRYWFERLLNEFPKSAYTPRAMFLLAQIIGQDTTNGKSVADSLYRTLVQRFPESEFAGEAARFLGLPQTDKSHDDAARLYAQGEQLLAAGSDSAAIDTFLVVVHEYPSSPFASKAQYAMGWVYEEMRSNPDSAVAQYRRLVSAYPNSEYAARVRPKLVEVDIQKKELQDSARKDSIKNALQLRGSAGKGNPADSLGSPPERAEKPLQKSLPDSSMGPGLLNRQQKQRSVRNELQDTIFVRKPSNQQLPENPLQKGPQDSSLTPGMPSQPQHEEEVRKGQQDSSVAPGPPIQQLPEKALQKGVQDSSLAPGAPNQPQQEKAAPNGQPDSSVVPRPPDQQPPGKPLQKGQQDSSMVPEVPKQPPQDNPPKE